jgi:hypothetical protein
MPMPSQMPPEEIDERVKPRDPPPTPQLPPSWTAAGLLFPFGDANPTMANYDQLVVANIAYDSTGPNMCMRVSLYLLEDLTYYDFLFIGSQWYWLVSTLGQRPTAYYGPFTSASLEVPLPDFLAFNGANYANTWRISGTMTDGWVIPTASAPGIPPHGTWYSMNSNSSGIGWPWRVLNLDNNNPVGIPILGSYYLAYLPGFRATGPLNLPGLIQGIPNYSGNAPSPMVSQRDIQTAMANPLASAPCTLADIQAVIPGISHPSVQPPPSSLPQWTNKTYIQGWTIGCDPIPYFTQVWYWWDYKHQRTSFIGYGLTNGTGTYDDRIDNVLYSNYFTSPVYKWNQGQWNPSCPIPCFPGVGLPQPNWVADDGGKVKAMVSGNADFGLKADQTMLMIAAAMPRPPNALSLFWLWFTDDQKGVLFSECNYVDTVVSHDLQVIDYEIFERNAGNVNQDSFPDPCWVAECKSAPRARTRGF